MDHTDSLKHASFFQNAEEIKIPRNNFLSCSPKIKLELRPHHAYSRTRSIMRKETKYTLFIGFVLRRQL